MKKLKIEVSRDIETSIATVRLLSQSHRGQQFGDSCQHYTAPNGMRISSQHTAFQLSLRVGHVILPSQDTSEEERTIQLSLTSPRNRTFLSRLEEAIQQYNIHPHSESLERSAGHSRFLGELPN